MQLNIDKSLLEQKKHGTFHFPILVSYETISNYDSGSFLLHWHPEIELTLILNGTMSYKINGSVIQLKEGDALFCNAGALHSGKMNQLQDCEYISITFDSKLVYGYENSLLYEKYVRPLVQNVSIPYLHFDYSNEWAREVIKEIGHIITLYQLGSLTHEIDIVISLQKIWKELFINAKATNKLDNISSTTFSRFRSIIAYIDLHYSEKITLSDISEQIHLCESECCRLFKKIMHMSLFDYIQEYRIKKATELLIGTNENINRISELTGFGNSNHFSKTFRKYMDVSPRTFRKQNKQ